MPTVLFHTNNEAKKAQIFALCRTLHFAARAIAPGDAGQAVGALAGLSAGAPVEKLPAGYALPEVLIFSGDAGEALDVFLAAYREAGIEPIALKAVVTPHNTAWSVRALVEELQKERTAMRLYRQQKP